MTTGMNRRIRALMIALPLTVALATAAGPNSSIHIGDNEDREGNISAVNGSVTVGDGATIRGDLSSVNGDIFLSRGAVVGGSVIIEEARGHSDRRAHPQRIELEDGSEICGDIVVEDPDLEVEVYVRSGSRIGGRVEGARVIRE
jgi:hypothetical protein